jgi:type II secretory pathway pseudopilin PulG
MTAPMRYDARGETLIESLISIMIIGIAVAAILGAVASGSTLTGGHRDLTGSDVGLKAVAESVKSASLTYIDNAVPDTGTPATKRYTIPVSAIPTGYTAHITAVQCWQSSTTTYDVTDPAAFPACSTSTDNGLQLVTLTLALTSNGGSLQTTQILKRKP